MFVGFFYWESDFARKQWCEDFAASSYDRLGWRRDGLRAMAALGVESYCLPLGENTKEHIEIWERMGFPKGGVKPPGPLAYVPGGVL